MTPKEIKILAKTLKKELQLKETDLDEAVFTHIEAQIEKKLSRAQKAHIRYILDMDTLSRNAFMNQKKITEDNLDKWK